MSDDKLFTQHSPEEQAQYERSARLDYGPTVVNESIQRWNSYTKAEQDAIFAEAGQVYTDLVAALEVGTPPDSAEVQAILERWQSNLRNFYEPTLEIMRGLGELYNTDPAFMKNFCKLHADLPTFLQASITRYVDDLETAEIERMLAEDEAKNNKLSRSISRLSG